MATEITIDGSMGEGGGQVLRSSLALSLCTGAPLLIDGIRARRPKPGLQAQHLTAVEAAAQIGDAEIEGAHKGSTRLRFRPRSRRAGDYAFDIGTAGSTGLVLQAVLPALALADAPSVLRLRGGTHNPGSPPFDFLAQVLAPALAHFGVGLKLELRRHGFYPEGGGEIVVHVTPTTKLAPWSLAERGALRRIHARALLSKLPETAARRALHLAQQSLGASSELELVEAAGPGHVLLIGVESEHVQELFTAFGQKSLRPEAVARGAVDWVQTYLASEAPIGPHLADQLVVFMGLAGGGSLSTVFPSRHTRTVIDVVQAFLGRAPRLREDGKRYVLEMA